MKEVLVTFEEQNLEGIVAVGTYLMDAAKRLGVEIDDDCREGADEHNCSMRIGEGANLLSEPTSVEIAVLSEEGVAGGERLSCQTKIDKPGELKIMSVSKPKEEEKAEEPKTPESEYRKEFEEMPLDKKYASLVELEAIALGETFSYVLNSPYEAFGKVMDVLADFGWKKDQADHDAKIPEEHSSGKDGESEQVESAEGDTKASDDPGNDGEEPGS